MNFLCDNCKQKYHVADEKVQGREVSRFKCKKCGHVTEIRAGQGSIGGPSPDSTGALSVSSSTLSVPPSSNTGSYPAPATGPNPAATAAPKPAPRPPTATGLPVAPRTPTITTPSVPAVGAPKAPTSSALPTAKPAAGALPTARPTGAAAAPARAPSATGLPSSSATTTGTRAVTSSSPLRTGLATKTDPPVNKPTSSASALLHATETGWYAGVRDVPVGPLTRAELSAKIEAGDVTPDSLVWREGLDDWRPLRNVDELADLLREVQQKVSGGLLGTMGRKDKAPTNVVPIAQARTKPPAESHAEPVPAVGDDEPTKMTSLAELVAATEAPAPPPTTKPFDRAPAPKPAEKPAEKPVTKAAPPPAPAVTSTPPATASAEKSAVLPLVTPAATEAPTALISTPIASPPPPAAPTVVSTPPIATPLAAPIVAPIATPAPAPPAATPVNPAADPFALAPAVLISAPPVTPLVPAVVPTTVATPTIATTTPPAKPGVPMGMWVLMVGVLFTGVALGVFLRPAPVVQQPTPPTTPQTTPTPPTPPPANVRSVGAQIQLPEDPPPTPPTPTAQPTPPAPTPAGTQTAAADPNARRPRHSTATAPRLPTNTPSLAALEAQLGGPSGGSSPPAPSAPAPSTMRASNAENEPSGPTGEARASQVLGVLQRSNVVNNCWTAAQRRNPAHPREQLRVTLEVNPIGRATVSVAGAQDPDLANCIQGRARSQPYGPGGAIAASANYNLELNH